MASHQNQNNHVKWPLYSNKSVSESSYDLPAFEEAFDTYSLKKFYREQESIHSESTGLSPQPENSFFEEYQFLDGKENEKPWLNTLSSKARNEFTSLGTESLFPLDFDLTDKVFQMPCRRTQSSVDQPSSTPLEFHQQAKPKPSQNFHISLTNQSLKVSKPEVSVGKLHIPFKFDDLFAQAPVDSTQIQPFESVKNVHNGPATVNSKRGKKIFKIIRDAPHKTKLMLSPKKKTTSAHVYQNIPQPSYCSPNLSEKSSDLSKKTISFNFNLTSSNINQAPLPNYFNSGNEQPFQMKNSVPVGGYHNMPFHFTQS